MIKSSNVRLFHKGVQLGGVSEFTLRVSMGEMLGVIHLMRVSRDYNGKTMVDEKGKVMEHAESYRLMDIKISVSGGGVPVYDFELAEFSENVI